MSMRDRNKKYYWSHKEQENARYKAYYEKNRERIIKRAVERVRDNPRPLVPEVYKKANKLYYQRHADEEKVRTKLHKREHKDYYRNWQLVKRYGITLEQWTGMYEKQCGMCAICSQPFGKKICVDHNHATGVVRGLLCNNCNVGIGRLNDDPQLVYRAYQYLTQLEGVA